jgi:hypothetical protein
MEIQLHLETAGAIIGLEVDEVFPVVPEFKCMLKIRFRGQISAKLMEVDIITGAEKPLLSFGGFPSTPDFQDRSVGNGHDSPDPLLDFTNKAYYVEATLTARTIVIGNPAAISVIQLVQALF